METKPTAAYSGISNDQALKLLGTSTTGLTKSEAEARASEFGYNEVVEGKKSPLQDLLRFFWGPMPWLLESTVVLSFVIQDNFEAIVILVLMGINAIIGSLHTRTSRKAIELLKSKLVVKTKVLRDGRWSVEDARVIVPGDIIEIGLGDLIPADIKILQGEISVDQSGLTGESLPVAVREEGIVYSSSIVMRGQATALVVNTGANTYFGKTAELVKIAKPKSHQEEVVLSVIKYLMYVSGAALALVLVDAAFTNGSVVVMVSFALIFLLGAIPVALPVIFAVDLSLGALELTRKGVLVTQLNSLEDAASMNVLCLDKTGTITQNKLSIVEIKPFGGFSEDDVRTIASLASKQETKDAIDLAVIDLGKTSRTDTSGYKQITFTPFEPATKRSEATIENGVKKFKAIKGAPQIILSICNDTEHEIRDKAKETVQELSRKGYRTLAVAKSENNQLDNFSLVGILALADPPRPDSKPMIEELRTLGVRPKMLTGDNLAIAQEIALEVSIGNKIYRATEMASLNENEKAKIIEESDGFAEVYPEDKYSILKLLQSKGDIVGMTGDGVNDSPALKQAEVGIAVKDSSDVAKASASIVLTEPGMSVIIDAIKASRQIYRRLLTWVINKVTGVIQLVGLLTIGFFWLHGVILSILGIVLLVFGRDFGGMSLATDNATPACKPDVWNLKSITLASLVLGIPLVIEGLITIFIGIAYFNLNWMALQTYVMLIFLFSSQAKVLIVRDRKHFWASRPGNALLITCILTTVAFVLMAIYGILVPALTPYEVLVVLTLSLGLTFILDIPKYYVFKRFGF